MEDPKNWWLGRVKNFCVLIGGIALFVGLVMLFDISPDGILFYVLLFGFIIVLRPLVMQ